MRRNVFTLALSCLIILLNLNVSGQDLYYSINNNAIVLNIHEINKYEERIYFINHLYNNPNFITSIGDKNGEFIISPSDNNYDFTSSFKNFYKETSVNFNQLSKDDAAYLSQEYKNDLPDDYINHIMMELYIESRNNNICANALPFCTDIGIYNFPAGVNAGEGELGPEYDCLSSTPNPAWYYMKISSPGNINIYMYSNPNFDIDFCCWGPFNDPIEPCPNGLTYDKIVSCSYSPDATETCEIPSSAQAGEYYILIITNYSNHECNITFEKQSGSGTTDCSILPPPIESNSPICVGETLQLEAQFVEGAQYLWTGPNGWTSNSRNPSRNNVTLDMSGEYNCSIIVGSQQSSETSISVDIHDISETNIFDTICYGEDYLENNFNIENPHIGNHQETLYLNTSIGCDSIIRLNLTVGENYYYEIHDSICEGEDYFDYNQNIINASPGIYELNYNPRTILDCDSIFNITLNVLPEHEEASIYGIEDIKISTDLTTGYYRYFIDPIENCSQYTWSIENPEWQIFPNNNECFVLASTPIKNTLYVNADIMCGIASGFIELNAGFIGDQNNSRITMYPNPVKDFVNIQQNDITKISVYDSYGQLVMRKEYNFDSHVTLDFSSLKSSIYIIEIITLDKTYVERISIVK